MRLSQPIKKATPAKWVEVDFDAVRSPKRPSTYEPLLGPGWSTKYWYKLGLVAVLDRHHSGGMELSFLPADEERIPMYAVNKAVFRTSTGEWGLFNVLEETAEAWMAELQQAYPDLLSQ